MNLRPSGYEAEVAAGVATSAAEDAANSADIASASASVSTDKAVLSAQEAAASAVESASSANSAFSSAATAVQAAQATGAPLFATLEDGETATIDGEIFMVQTKAATGVYQNVTGSGTLLGWLGDILFDGVAELFSNSLTGFLEGQIIRTRSEGFSYRVAAENATDQHITTAGGVKLYVQETPDGFLNVLAFGADNTNSINAQPEIHKAINAAGPNGKVLIPEGDYKVEATIEIPLSTTTGRSLISGYGANLKLTGSIAGIARARPTSSSSS